VADLWRRTVCNGGRGNKWPKIEKFLTALILYDTACYSRDIVYSAGDIWICKPIGLNQGRGIFLIRDLGEFRSTYLEQEFPDIGRRPKHPSDKIVQRYRTSLVSFLL